MNAADRKIVRCAIYTRKSSEEGLDQAFNSLHAQREACEAYIKSQAHEGWRAIVTTYDDGGFSGGNLKRPALRRLLGDIDAGRIDTIVVYKIDRLTRSLSDFAKIVDRLDTAGASFVSITQAFNTTTSMGWLTLNVLLSFAQFEREVTGERIRDKIAASKAKGMWMGGNLPLGYDPPIDLTTRALVVNAAEADQVRLIFERYLALKSVGALEAWLDDNAIRSKVWTARTGTIRGGLRLSRGALFHLLKNRTYIGEIPHRGASHPGAHLPIVDRAIFDQVQDILTVQCKARRERPTRVAAQPLCGILFDADGQPMSPSFGYGRGGKIYRYYVSAPLQQGRKVRVNPDAMRRVAADALEAIVRQHLAGALGAPEDEQLSSMLESVRRIEVEAQELRLHVRTSAVMKARREGLVASELGDIGVIVLPFSCRVRGGRTWLVSPTGSSERVSCRRDPVLIRGLRQAHRIAAALGWRFGDSAPALLNAQAPKNAYQRKLCRLAFLAPDIQRAILGGLQPPGLTLDHLLRTKIPLDWSEQRKMVAGALN
jgi:site-specific DNA recombinase